MPDKRIIINIIESTSEETRGRITITQEGWENQEKIPLCESIGYLEIAKQALLNENR